MPPCIMVEVASADDPDLADLRAVAERQGIPLTVRVLGDEMTQVLLCAGPGLLVVKRDGLLFFRRPGQPDAPVPYAAEHYPVFLNSARQKHGLSRVLGPSSEEAPCLPDDAPIPTFRRDCLASGEEVYHLEPAEDSRGRHAGQPELLVREPLP